MKTALVFLPVRLPNAPSLGPACLKSYLNERGHDVFILDYNIKIYNGMQPEATRWWFMESAWAWVDLENYRRLIEPLIRPYFVQLAKELLIKKVDAVGFTVLNVNYFPAITAIEIIRKICPEIKIFYGGPNITKDNAVHDLEVGRIDAAIVGEGEESCHALLTHWKLGKTGTVAGVFQRDAKGKGLEGPKQAMLKIKDLPIPDFEDFDLTVYKAKYLPIEFSRGCTAKCTFCSETVFWVSYRSKTALKIFNEMKYNVEKYAIHEYRIVDSLLNGNHMLLEELTDLIIADGLVVHWYGFARIDKKLTPKVLEKMARAGCMSLTYGIESGSQKVLDLMRKDYKIKEIYDVVRDTHAAGIWVNTQILIGFPGENWFNFFETVKLLWDLRHSFRQIFPGNPLAITPNTHIIENLDLYGIVKNNYRGGEWHTRFYMNNVLLRKFRFWVLKMFLKTIQLPQGYAVAHALGPEFDHVDEHL
ncbi:MAG: radical SAM protein [Halobacteriovoraceae bacterium]|jgi:anaerobic magnesium-protoporphyrin IX monomethyl ester cyclase|nr:radical SAM protein [Halobacteriovoraceae bacterium]